MRATLAREGKFDGQFLGAGPHVISIGRLVPWKGFAALIEIMPELVRRHPGIVLHIVGDGPQEKTLARLVATLHVHKHVQFHGRVAHEKVLELLLASDLYVLNTAYEGLSHQLLEAMAVGTPILTTSIGANESVVQHGKDALLVGYNDRGRLARAIHTLIAHPLYARELAEQAKVRVTHYSKEKMLAKTVALLKIGV